MCLRTMDLEVVTARKGPMASRHPTDMRLILRVASYMALEVVLALETLSAVNDWAIEFSLVPINFRDLNIQVMTGLFAKDVTVKK